MAFSSLAQKTSTKTGGTLVKSAKTRDNFTFGAL